MRDLEDKWKISVRSIGEVDEALGVIVARVRGRMFWKTCEKEPSKPGKASVVNALILWVESQPAEEQRRILAEGHSLLDALLAKPMSATDQPVVEGLTSNDVPPPTAAKKKGRAG